MTNLRLHQGHRLFVWPGTSNGPSVYCRSCDLFLEIPNGLYYLSIDSAEIHEQGSGPAH